MTKIHFIFSTTASIKRILTPLFLSHLPQVLQALLEELVDSVSLFHLHGPPMAAAVPVTEKSVIFKHNFISCKNATIGGNTCK